MKFCRTSEWSRRFLTLAGVVLLAFSGSLQAVAVTDVDPEWTNPDVSFTGSVYLTGPISDASMNSASLHWGYEVNFLGIVTGKSDPQSGYLFESPDSVSPSEIPVILGSPFVLGTFVHENFPIEGGAVSGVDLDLLVDLDTDGLPGNELDDLAFTFHFDHNETPNPAPDEVTVSATTQEQFMIDGVTYTMHILGFIRVDENGDPIDENGDPVIGDPEIVELFITNEGESNYAHLIATIDVPEMQVPEPETYLLLGSVLALGALAKRRKARA